jgi:hypothetical protein
VVLSLFVPASPGSVSVVEPESAAELSASLPVESSVALLLLLLFVLSELLDSSALSLVTVIAGGAPGTSSASIWLPPQPDATIARNATRTAIERVRGVVRMTADRISGAARPCGGRSAGSR